MGLAYVCQKAHGSISVQNFEDIMKHVVEHVWNNMRATEQSQIH